MNRIGAQFDRDGTAHNAPTPTDRAAAALCKVLGSDVDVHRCAAAQALGQMGHPASVDALIAALVDDDEDVRADAAGGLSRRPDPRAAKPLLDSLLGDPCIEVKLAAIEALGRLRDAAALPWLMRLVRGRDEEIVWDENEFHASGWDDWTDIQLKAIEALAEIGAPDAVGDIVAALQDEFGQNLIEVGFGALARLGEPGLSALAGFLEDDDDDRRRHAAAVLAKLNGAVTGSEITQDAEERSEEALSEEEFEAEAARLGDVQQPLHARLEAIGRLAAHGGEEAVAALASILGDADRQIRLTAMTALVRLSTTLDIWPNAAGEALLAALRGELVSAPEPEPVIEPEKSEAEEQDEPPESDPDPESTSPTSTLSAMLSGHSEAAQVMEEPERGVELTRLDMERLALAVRKKGKRVVPVTPTIAPHHDVPRFAARLLGDLPHGEVAVELAKALSENDGEKRLAAADSLGRIGQQLGLLPGEAVEALLDALLNTDRDLRLLAVRALGNSGDAAVAKRLIRCLRDGDSFIRTEAVRGLAQLEAVGPEIERRLDDPEPAVRLAAAEAIAGAQGRDSLDTLIDFTFAFEGYHRRQTARLLRDLDAGPASDRFVAVLNDQEQQPVWQVAIEALEEIHRASPDEHGLAQDNGQSV